MTGAAEAFRVGGFIVMALGDALVVGVRLAFTASR